MASFSARWLIKGSIFIALPLVIAVQSNTVYMAPMSPWFGLMSDAALHMAKFL